MDWTEHLAHPLVQSKRSYSLPCRLQVWLTVVLWRNCNWGGLVLSLDWLLDLTVLLCWWEAVCDLHWGRAFMFCYSLYSSRKDAGDVISSWLVWFEILLWLSILKFEANYLKLILFDRIQRIIGNDSINNFELNI